VAPVNSPAYLDTTAGLRSLAEKCHADIEEVRAAAAEDNLRRFLVKTGNAPAKPKTPNTLAAAARMQLLARQQDPWS
jgi:hypothetical protein